MDTLFDECSRFVAEKRFIFWLVDDEGLFAKEEEYLKEKIVRAREKSKGLKNPFIFIYTPKSKVEALLKFLLEVASPTKSKQQSNKKKQHKRTYISPSILLRR